MPVTLDAIHTSGQVFTPPRLLLFSLPGWGKTSLAAEAPSPIFLQTSCEFPAGMEASTFGHLATFNDVMDALRALRGEHSFKTLILDHLTELDALVKTQLCKDNHWADLAAAGHGKGYVAFDNYWKRFLGEIAYLHERKNMGIILIAHMEITYIPNPAGEEFPSYAPLLSKRIRDAVTAPMDGVFMIGPSSGTKDTGGGHVIADGGNSRFIYTHPRPHRSTKSRYIANGMPDCIEYKVGKGFAELRKYMKKDKENK